MKEMKLHLSGMQCTGCEKKIEDKMNQEDGIIEVKANFRTATVDVVYDEKTTSLGTISKALNIIGYPIVLEKKQKNKLN